MKKKTVFVFPNNQIALDIKPRIDMFTNHSDYNALFALNRDRKPDAGWYELRRNRLDQAVEMELTVELRKLLLEDLAYAYGQNSEKFTEKLKEFDLL